MDATYFKQFCVVCYQDDEDGYTQLIRVTDGEHFVEIKEDLDNLIKLGVQIESITTDGHKSALKAIKISLPDVTVQRCLVHIQRMCLLWLTRFPKHLAGAELRALVLMLLRIKRPTIASGGLMKWPGGMIGTKSIWAKKHITRKQADTVTNTSY